MPDKTQRAIWESKIRQSLIDEFNRRSSPEFACILERLGQIARAFPLPWTHYVRLDEYLTALPKESEVAAEIARTREWLERQAELRRLARRPRR